MGLRIEEGRQTDYSPFDMWAVAQFWKKEVNCWAPWDHAGRLEVHHFRVDKYHKQDPQDFVLLCSSCHRKLELKMQVFDRLKVTGDPCAQGLIQKVEELTMILCNLDPSLPRTVRF